jgi:pyridoxal 5'-phosphate synthase pdxT subunit
MVNPAPNKNSSQNPKPMAKKSLVRGKNKIIGVLSLQGDFLEHITTLRKIGVSTRDIRLAEDLQDIDALIIPGGESTTMVNLLDSFKLREPLVAKIKKGMPVWGTCAGMILLASKLVQDRPTPLGVMDITVSRNAFGRQIESFETDLDIKGLNKPMHATFIRAPWIVSVGPKVEVLSKLPDGTIVAARQGNILVTSFHPELTEDTRLHEYFVNTVSSRTLHSEDPAP